MTPNQHKIMVVDDDPRMRLTLGVIIEEEGYDVLEASDGYQAIELAKEHSLDLIFMDIIMPGMHGVDAFREIKKISPGTPVVMMTGFSNGELVKNALDEGVHSLIHKPFKVSRIIDTLRGVLKTEMVLVAARRGWERESWRQVLEQGGYVVSVASDAVQVVGMAAVKHYDVIILDSGLPNTDCYALLGQIRVFDPRVKVIMTASDSAAGTSAAGVDLGDYSLLSGPVNQCDILALMQGSKGRGEDRWTSKDTSLLSKMRAF